MIKLQRNICLYFYIFSVLPFAMPSCASDKISRSINSCTECQISDSEYQRLMNLDYQKFDQDLEGGWRVWGNTCHKIAIKLLADYLLAHGPALENWQTKVLRWHQGQIFGVDDNYPSAIALFEQTYDGAIPKSGWDSYVDATIAFMKRKLPQLKSFRDELAANDSWEGNKINLKIVDCLVRDFEKSYSVAYGCNNQP